MKNILLPTDFSENSLNAIHYAMAFFKGGNHTFYILNIQKVSEYTTAELVAAAPSESIYEAVLNDNKQKLEALVNGLQTENKNEAYKFESLLDFDAFTDAIRQTIDTKNIDLIIMGTNGVTGTEEIVFGSNTLSVIRQIDCPVLAIPEGFKFDYLETILFTEFIQKKIDSTKMNSLFDIIEMHKAVLKILIINEKETKNEFQENNEALFKTINFETYSLKGIPITQAINSFVQLNKVEMHALLVEKKNFLERLFFGSETSKISYETKVPLLVMHY